MDATFASAMLQLWADIPQTLENDNIDWQRWPMFAHVVLCAATGLAAESAEENIMTARRDRLFLSTIFCFPYNN